MKPGPANEPTLILLGAGAVSPAGWTLDALFEAMEKNARIPVTPCERPGGGLPWACQVRRVPDLPAGLLPRSPRLRRSSGITKLAMGAAVDALHRAGHEIPPKDARFGLILCVMNGCVDFTGRFYTEVLDTPALASPILFPETVFNAPASHVAQALGIDGPVSTLIGEPTNFAEGLRMAGAWLDGDLVDQCLVIAAEEHSWLSSEAAAYYHHDLIASEGAAALLLAREGSGPRLRGIEGPFPFTDSTERAAGLNDLVKALATRLQQLRIDPAQTILIDGQSGITTLDQLEAAAWSGCAPPTRWSPKRLLGESMGASVGLQVALAAAVAETLNQPTIVSSPGYNAASYGFLLTPA